MCHNEQSGFAEDWLHLGRVQARWATPKPLRLGHAQARGWLGMALDLLGALALLPVCTVFRDSNSVTNRSARRTQRASFYLHSAEAKPALAAKQQQYFDTPSMRFGIAKLDTAFPFVSALTFRYL